MPSKPFGVRAALAAALATTLATTLSVPAAGTARAQAPARPPETEALCAAVRDAAPPPGDLPTPTRRAALAGCDAERLHYDPPGRRDPVAARHCALIEREAPAEMKVFGGPAILMALYANGDGVRRDLRLALRYACEVEGAPAEVEGRVAHLARRAANPALATPFDYCDDVTSGFAMGHCADRDRRARLAGDRARLDAIGEGLPGTARPAFARLREAAASWAATRSDNEVDRSGTARAMLVIEERNALDAAFETTLRDVVAGRVGPASPAALKAADDRLNAAHRRRLAALEAGRTPAHHGITVAGVRAAGRAWIAYRDRFAEFARALRPDASATGLVLLLTERRAAMLRDAVP